MSRPKYVPTEDQRSTVKSLSAYGMSHEGIAHIVGLRTSKTLRKHFRKELDLGGIEGTAHVAQTRYEMAKSGKYPTATIHYLEKRLRWLDVDPPEIRQKAIPDFIVALEKKAA
jgi:hypothetical protein